MNPISTALAPNPRPTLLVVDDEAGPRESMRMVFKDRYDVVLANCGRAGVEYAKQNRVDLAILDIRMPDLSGVEVLQELKQIDPHTEVVLLTGCETLETARAAVRLGAADYLNKPVDVSLIRDLLARYYQRRAARLATEEQIHAVRSLVGDLQQALAGAQVPPSRLAPTPVSATPPPALPGQQQEHQRRAWVWERFKCQCGNVVEVSPAFRSAQVECKGCSALIKLIPPSAG